jgi:hypothetical protein
MWNILAYAGELSIGFSFSSEYLGASLKGDVFLKDRIVSERIH